jgi:NADPH:quinone reductase-like Zn-dependent oxidoreductase
MKAVYLEQKAAANSLVEGEIARPSPKPDEALIRVYATAIMPTELDWEPTFNQASGEPRPFPVVLSHEFSGVVESVGAKVKDFKPGDEVYGLNDWFTNGAQAEYCVVASNALAPKPKSLRHTEAAVVPISALTAWQALIENGKLERKQRVLIHGGSGGVGTFAVQIGRWRGAYVIATASAENIEFVRALGADQVIDYRAAKFEDLICDVDLVLDGVGGETLERSWKVLKPDGKLFTIVGSTTKQPVSQRSRDAFMLVRADGAQLAQIGAMIDGGELRVFMEAVYALEDAREAYARAEQGKMRGKIALSVVDETIVSEPKHEEVEEIEEK